MSGLTNMSGLTKTSGLTTMSGHKVTHDDSNEFYILDPNLAFRKKSSFSKIIEPVIRKLPDDSYSTIVLSVKGQDPVIICKEIPNEDEREVFIQAELPTILEKFYQNDQYWLQIFGDHPSKWYRLLKRQFHFNSDRLFVINLGTEILKVIIENQNKHQMLYFRSMDEFDKFTRDKYQTHIITDPFRFQWLKLKD